MSCHVACRSTQMALWRHCKRPVGKSVCAVHGQFAAQGPAESPALVGTGKVRRETADCYTCRLSVYDRVISDNRFLARVLGRGQAINSVYSNTRPRENTYKPKQMLKHIHNLLFLFLGRTLLTGEGYYHWSWDYCGWPRFESFFAF